MATIVYRQKWTAGSFSDSHPGAYHSTAFGGPDAPIAGYPELGSMENIHTVADGSRTVVDAVDTSDYTTSGLALVGVGPLTNGQFDTRKLGDLQLHARVLVKLKASALLENDYGSPMILCAAGQAGTNGEDPGGDFYAWLEMFRGFNNPPVANRFTWVIQYRSVNGGGTAFLLKELDGPDDGGNADDADHDLDIALTPSTVTGAYNGIGGIGSAVVAADGAIEFKVDDVVVISATGLQLVINHRATAQPNIYYGRAIHLGDGSVASGADMPGPTAEVELYYGGRVGVPNPPPPAAPVPCEPESTITNGGKGKSGCNDGGTGFDRVYYGPFGDVPIHANPADGESLTNKERAGLEVWVELRHVDYPSGDVSIHRRAFEELGDPAAYEGGRKPGGLLGISEIEHGIGNEQGSFEAATIDMAFSDTLDRLFRNLADDQDVDGDEVTVKIASDAAREGFA